MLFARDPAAYQAWLAQQADPSRAVDAVTGVRLASPEGRRAAEIGAWRPPENDAVLARQEADRQAAARLAARQARRTAMGWPAAWGDEMPKPWQINPAVWDSIGKTGRDLTLGFAEAEGWQGADFERLLNAARPQGIRPQQVAVQYAAPRAVRGPWG
jgi:hypothetical protein